MDDASYEHFLAGIRSVPVSEIPFPHGYIENVFPASFYSELLANLPPDDACRLAPSEFEREDGTPPRLEFWLSPRFFNRLQNPIAGCWYALAKRLSDARTVDALLTPFNRFLSKRTQDDRHSVAGRLVRECGKYTLQPHLDAEFKLLTMVVYLPQDDARRELGTALYERMPDGGFRTVTTTPYLANSASIMLRTDSAWHGGSWDSDGYVRHTMHLYLRTE